MVLRWTVSSAAPKPDVLGSTLGPDLYPKEKRGPSLVVAILESRRSREPRVEKKAKFQKRFTWSRCFCSLNTNKKRKILEEDTGRKLGAGQVGEVVVQTPYLMRGYLKRPEETAAALRHGWYCVHFNMGSFSFLWDDVIVTFHRFLYAGTFDFEPVWLNSLLV